MYIIDRPDLLKKIKASILNNKITNIYGLLGVGKTVICKKCIDTYFSDVPIYMIRPYEFNLDVETKHYQTGIYIFEDFSYEWYHKIEINQLYHTPLETKFIFISQQKIKENNVGDIEILPFSEKEVGQYLMMNLFYTEMMDIYERKIIKETNCNPLLVSEIVNILNKDTPYEINNLDIIYKPCIVDAFGKPIEKPNKSIIIAVTEVNDQLLYELYQNPNLLHNLSPYDFERVMAKIFEKKGFSVKITPQTRDGGKDIFIAKNDLCSFLFYVECKKYAPNRPVSIDIIQRLYGVVSAEKATGGIIATTSYFTKPAKDYVQEHQLNNQITLQDYDTICNILKTLY